VVAREPTADEFAAVARKVWGQENKALSRRTELRFGKHGSKHVNLDNLTWYDHQDGTGGGYVELYKLAGEPLPNGHDPAASSARPRGNTWTTYDYRDETGKLEFQVVRKPNHKFLQRRPTGDVNDPWDWHIVDPGTKKPLVKLVPYRLPELLAAHHDDCVFICEGEKDVDNVRKLGLTASCNPMGAGAWRSDYTPWFKDRDCVILPDNDQPGRDHAGDVFRALQGTAASALILELPGLGPKEDVSDWIKAGGDAGALVDLVAKAQPSVASTPPTRGIAGNIFADGYAMPEWLIDGVLQRGSFYGCTSLTQHGKTATWLFNACMIHEGRNLGGFKVAQGNVLILAGENPEDLKARMLGMRLAFNLRTLPYVMPGAFLMDEVEADKLRRDIEAMAMPLALILVDTASSFFPGDDDNSNTQQGAYARSLRTLCGMPGYPAVVVNCHPVKNAGRDSLWPRGGGAFLNELDGNFTLWSEDLGEMTTLGFNKLRGPAFAPFSYKLKTVPTGRHYPNGVSFDTIIAEPVDDFEAFNQSAQNISDDNAVLRILDVSPKLSLADIARQLMWSNAKGEPLKAKVQRAIQRLADDKLIVKHRRGGLWKATEKGKKEI
jgi:hypothetical protein